MNEQIMIVLVQQKMAAIAVVIVLVQLVFSWKINMQTQQ
jgi:hypothetical protein